MRQGSRRTIAKRFLDDNTWPFLGRNQELKQCLNFLEPNQLNSPSRLLHIIGESGTGKSFLSKELICQFSKLLPSSIALYINLEESEFESTDLEKRLASLASYPSKPTRKDPQHVPSELGMAKYLKPLPKWVRVLTYLYNGVKESASQIPIIGKIAIAFLPKELPVSTKRELVKTGRFWDYLIVTAQYTPVLLVLDNFQFLPDSIAMEIESYFAAATGGFRLVIVKRLREGIRDSWNLRCFGDHQMSVEIKPFSYNETLNLVRFVLGKKTPNLTKISEVIFRKSEGNPKQIWLQLRSYQVSLSQKNDVMKYVSLRQQGSIKRPVESTIGDYDETIQNLPSLDRLALQIVTLIMGGLRVEDLVGVLRWIVHPISEDEIKKTVLDLALVGLLIINGTQNDRVKVEHDLVTQSVRRITTEQETHGLRLDVVSALSQRLEHALDDEEYERLVDRLIGLLSPQEIRTKPHLLAHLIALIDKQYLRERFHYLTWLCSTPLCAETINLLPPHCLEAFLDAFQKTSQFDKGLATIELIRSYEKLSERKLALSTAKYLVQKFEYRTAESILHQTDPGSDRDVILFNILLNLCRDNEARQMVGQISAKDRLDEYQCVMLRNCSHLFSETEARQRLLQAKDGFTQLGLTFGEATTLNNLGVLELWAGNYDIAQNYLNTAHSMLKNLDSNEVYQPLTNLAILHALRNDLTLARQVLSEAKTAVSPWLKMDDLMLEFNLLVVDLIGGNIDIPNATAKAHDLWKKSLKLLDVRFRDVLGWFLHQMESSVDPVTFQPSPECKFRDKTYSGLEVFMDQNINGNNLTIVFILSPNWRY